MANELSLKKTGVFLQAGEDSEKPVLKLGKTISGAVVLSAQAVPAFTTNLMV